MAFRPLWGQSLFSTHKTLCCLSAGQKSVRAKLVQTCREHRKVNFTRRSQDWNVVCLMNPSHCKSSQQYLTVCKKYELWMRLHFDMKLTIHKQNQWRQCKVWCASLTLQRPPQLSWELLVNLWPEPEAPETHCLPETENTSSAAARGTLVQRTSAVLHLLWCRTVCRQCSSAPSDLLLSSDTPPPVCSAPAVAAELWPTASSALDPHSSHCESANWPPQLGNIKKTKNSVHANDNFLHFIAFTPVIIPPAAIKSAVTMVTTALHFYRDIRLISIATEYIKICILAHCNRTLTHLNRDYRPHTGTQSLANPVETKTEKI